MILRSERIAARLKQGEANDLEDPLVITPRPNLDKLEKAGSASVDLRLGTWFLNLRQARMPALEVTKDSQQSQLTKMHYVPFGGKYYLHPRCFVLGITLEWLRLPKDLAAFVIGRSSWGRRGLIIATATGVHPGFKGCLTLELTNVGEIPIAIKPGMSICQICFHTTESGASDKIDKSQYVGLRRPCIGNIELDDVASILAGVYAP